MAGVSRLVLFLTGGLLLLLLLLGRPCQANSEPEVEAGGTADHDTGTTHTESGDAHDSGGSHEDGGHGTVNISTLPIVSWKWHHVETPYLVALWILVSWLCKLGKVVFRFHVYMQPAIQMRCMICTGQMIFNGSV